MNSIKQLREAKGLTMGELARQTGIKRRDIWNLELGRYVPFPWQLTKLAETLGLAVDDLK